MRMSNVRISGLTGLTRNIFALGCSDNHLSRCASASRRNGRNRRDAEAQRDRWLSEHPEAKILRVSPVKPEIRTLLMRIGGQDVPRVSIEVEYE